MTSVKQRKGLINDSFGDFPAPPQVLSELDEDEALKLPAKKAAEVAQQTLVGRRRRPRTTVAPTTAVADLAEEDAETPEIESAEETDAPAYKPKSTTTTTTKKRRIEYPQEEEVKENTATQPTIRPIRRLRTVFDRRR
ncbi:hypothetical protein BV898_18307 [Hypsibius exemplaris]|uniref:Uncharacterized protein n=1 Tax=Hypsibius exemplaris TaxID=2072580 RepID=A0A9X6NJS0_HYPEX|nr:hypothetical protein BV898_18307 [Hypsibius exemplaris]